MRDMRETFRAFRRQPMYVSVSILTLGLGLGATGTIFGVTHAVLIAPLSYDEPDQLVAVWHNDVNRGNDRYYQSAATYLTYRDENRVFDDIGVWGSYELTATGLAQPEQIQGIGATEGVLRALRVPMLMGRALTAEDMTLGTPWSVILSYEFWRDRFGASPDVLGRTFRVAGTQAEIVGVLPADFQFFDLHPALFFPLRFNPAATRMGGGFGFRAVARLRPGVTIADANADIARMLPLTVEKFPSESFGLANLREWGLGPNVVPLKDDLVGDVSALLWILLGTVGIVLLIAAANVGNLMLIRMRGRRRELAVRAALGATGGRLARLVATESLMLAGAGGVGGLLLTFAGLRILHFFAPSNLPRLAEIRVTGIVAGVILLTSVVTGSALALLALSQRRGDGPASPLRAQGRGASHGRDSARVFNTLAVAQITLALLLLTGSGLLFRSFNALRAVQPGFEEPDRLLTFRFSPVGELTDPLQMAQLYERIVLRIDQLTGVESAAAVSAVTLDARSPNYATYVEGFPAPDNQFPPSRRYKWVAGDYFGTMGNPVLAGRPITWDDVHGRAPVVVVTANFAREHWGEPAGAIGKRLRNNPSDPWREIVGVVGDVHDDGVGVDPPALVYWPLAVESFDGSEVFVPRGTAFVMRTTVPPLSLVPELRAAVREIAPNLPIAEIETMAALVSRSMARTSFTLVTLAIAATVALVLGIVGVYGVIAFSVAQRTREIAVRMAVGASHADVRRMVLRRGAGFAVVGVGIGIVAAVALTRLIAALLYGVSPTDPVTLVAVALLLAVLTLAASYVPASRATRVDPVRMLHWD